MTYNFARQNPHVDIVMFHFLPRPVLTRLDGVRDAGQTLSMMLCAAVMPCSTLTGVAALE
jgi:hypothetical protein